MRKLLSITFLFIISSNLYSQKRDSVQLNLFVKCPFCDNSYIRNEIKNINHALDLNDANVVILGISETTGNGGTKYRLIFEGQKSFSEIKDTLIFETTSDATEDEIRDAYIRKMRQGLLAYLIKTDLYDKINYSLDIPNNDNNNQVIDNWKGWVNSISSSGWFDGEKSYTSFNVNSRIRISKTLEKWKLNYNLNHCYSESNFSSEDYEYRSVNRSISSSLLYVLSINNHWSAGLFTSTGNSTFNNYNFFMNFRPAIEYNIYPYEKSFEKQICISYKIGPNLYDYNDSTIFNKTKEFLYAHHLSLSLGFVKKWGSLYLSVEGNQYLHDFSLLSLDSFLRAEIRIVKGLSFYIYSGYSMIRNQISLPKEDISQEELLLHQRLIKTNYSYWGNLGLSFTFGSKFNNVVNPRFEN